MHSMQAGYLEKAQKYTDKALMQLEKLKSKCFMCICHSCNIKKGEFFYCLSLFVIFQCWTAARSSLPFKSFCWSILSCVDLSLVIRLQHYKRYADGPF